MLTLSDVAREAGVSEITVSRVIRSKGPVASQTRQRVEAAIRKVGYVPNRVAGALASSGSDLIGVIIPSLTNIVFPDMLRGLHDAVSPHGLRPVVCVTDYRLDSERELVCSILAWRPAALVLTGFEHDPQTRRMLEGGAPTTIEVMDIDGVPLDIAIGLSHAGAGRSTARYLLERGYRRFGYVGHDADRDHRAARRRDGFLETVREAGAQVAGVVALPEPSSVPAGRRGLASLLAGDARFDAVYFSNDDMAVGGYFHCLAAGLDVPGRIALAGFNGLDLGQTLPQPLTTVRSARYAIGLRAGQAVLDRLAGVEVPRCTDVGFELVPGATA